MNKNFNYIVPIFNKEDILPQTLEGIEKCASSESKIVLIVDGCTDRSESIVDEFIKNSSHKAEKILMPNVHMLLSVNAGLKTVKNGFSIIMQDDIILQDYDSEKKIVELYERINNLGAVSLRYGANIKPSSIKNMIRNDFKRMIVNVDLIQSPDDHADYQKGEYEKFYPRMCAINGPNIIPWNMLSKLGRFDENIAPYGYDDPEYCLRGLKEGFINGLFPLKYQSDFEWGGSRRSKEFQKNATRIINRSRHYVWNKHKDYLKHYLKNNDINRKLETL
ncbi:glycosyltransferase family A protein [Flavobacterium ajazii]|uniref:glycosyltransferase family A protein n=1 Tax=Flavobacterium ajazii TaxID=2692318 RepID=UPI0013D73901|nr:glycosyltransferase family A protein [Flavobacterium ajazii]